MKIPKHVLHYTGDTSRQFKQKKRYHARMIDRMVESFCFGMAYSPARNSLTKLRRIVKNIRTQLKVENWGN
jgi:hypothetical protein